MSSLKSIIFACMAGMLGAVLLLSFSCSGAPVNKPSGLPELIAFASDRDKPGHIYTINPDGTD
ncbi:MAG: hypothetical protein NTV42_09190, partial [Chloroflexi bacterium]|nr:hypothetical protein [Chloroflexota bacterium]